MVSHLKLAFNAGIKTKSFYSIFYDCHHYFSSFFPFDYYFHLYYLESIHVSLNEVSNDYLEFYTCTLNLKKSENLRTVFYAHIIWTLIKYGNVVLGLLNW